MPTWLRYMLPSLHHGNRLFAVSRLSRTCATRRGVTTASVRCGLSGRVKVDLHNFEKHRPTTPIVIYLPPCPQDRGEEDKSLPIPKFLQKYPVATINYRWAGFSFDPNQCPPPPPPQSESEPEPEPEDDMAGWPPLEPSPSPEGDGSDPVDLEKRHLAQWPTPIHDTLFAYQWILSNLSPTSFFRRDIYVYGTHLGATLASALGLTESYPHRKVAVRGIATYNGMYNWTMFLPGHPVYRSRPSRSSSPRIQRFEPPAVGSLLHYLYTHLGTLFPRPETMFDPFASPGLFFHNPGMLVPLHFASEVPAASQLIPDIVLRYLKEAHDAQPEVPGVPKPSLMKTLFKRPNRGTLKYPPGHSSLRIPNSLIMHDTSPLKFEIVNKIVDEPKDGMKHGGSGGGSGKGHHSSSSRRDSSRTWMRQSTNSVRVKQPIIENTFAGHAIELVHQMRRSITMHEFRERLKTLEEWELESMEKEAKDRVKLMDMGEPQGNWAEVSSNVEDAAAMWLQERIVAAKKEDEARYKPRTDGWTR